MIPRDNRTNKQRSIARTTFEGRRQESFTDGQGTPCDAVVCCLCQPGLLILGGGGRRRRRKRNYVSVCGLETQRECEKRVAGLDGGVIRYRF
jgi:hypothetical protein